MPSTTRTARTRDTGTVASLRWTSPREIRSRSPSRVTVKPPKVTIAPTVESSQARTSSATAPTTIAVTVCGSQRIASSPCFSSKSCWITWPPAASTGSRIPSWPAVSAAIASSRPAIRRLVRSCASSSATAAAACGRAARSSATASGVSAGSEISPPLPAAPVCTSTAKTPNRRCSGPWWTSIASIRSSRTSVSFVLKIPVWWWIASAPMRYVVDW